MNGGGNLSGLTKLNPVLPMRAPVPNDGVDVGALRSLRCVGLAGIGNSREFSPKHDISQYADSSFLTIESRSQCGEAQGIDRNIQVAHV